MQNIGQDTLKEVLVPVPTADEQEHIANFLDWKVSQVESVISKKSGLSSTLKGLDLLAEYHSALITAAVTGQIDVRGVAVPPPG